MEQYIATNVLLALHIIFMVTWFSGLFYIVRLFVYHKEAEDEDEFAQRILQQQYRIMEKRLWYGITWPSMVMTIFFGLWLLVRAPVLLGQPWMHMKLGMVFFLILYHVLNHLLFLQAQKDRIEYSGFKLRIWNEGATIFLVSIVFIVILGGTKHGGGFDWKWGVLGILIFALALYLAVLLYKRIRNKKKKDPNSKGDLSDGDQDLAKR
ncbi:MAG: CopD family protein [Flavobacteriales bacterium]